MYQHLRLLSTFSGETKCITTSAGPQRHVPCVFPFTLNGKTHNACTLDDGDPGDTRPWCSTKVKGSGAHIGGRGNWGVCGKQCPVELGGDKYTILKTTHLPLPLPYISRKM